MGAEFFRCGRGIFFFDSFREIRDDSDVETRRKRNKRKRITTEKRNRNRFISTIIIHNDDNSHEERKNNTNNKDDDDDDEMIPVIKVVEKKADMGLMSRRRCGGKKEKERERIERNEDISVSCTPNLHRSKRYHRLKN